VTQTRAMRHASTPNPKEVVMAMQKRRKKFDGASAAAVVAGGLGSAGAAAGLGKLGVPPAIVGTALTTIGITGAALLENRARIALGACTGTGALVLISAALQRTKKDQQVSESYEHEAGRLAQAGGKPSKKGKERNADLIDHVGALFEQARTDLALEDEDARYYRAA
jgi:hypothetical protein